MQLCRHQMRLVTVYDLNLFVVLKILLYSPAEGYLCYLKCAHSNTQTKPCIVGYLFDGCYVGAIMESAKITKMK